MSVKVGLPPVAREDARLLILGSLPGDASLAAAQYYAHPRNHFWPLIGDVIGRNLLLLEYPARLEALQSAGIALWDVVASAVRPGSLDQKIGSPQMNELHDFAKTMPNLRAVAFNGQKAALLARKAFQHLPLFFITLPSSSPAYTLSLAAKATAWTALKSYLIVGT